MRSGSVVDETAIAREEKGMSPSQRWREAVPFLVLVPAVGLMVVLYLYPFTASIYRSFLDRDGTLSLANYAKSWHLYQRDVFFSLGVTVLSTVISVGLSIVLAAYLRLTTGRIRRVIAVVYRIPIFIPFVVVAQMMNTFLAPHGLLNIFLAQLGLIDLNAPLRLFNWQGLTFGFVWKQTAFTTLIVLGGFEMVDNSYIEAARSIGANLLQVVLRVMAPMSLTSIAVGAILVFTSTMGTFTLPFMIVAGEPTTVTVDIAHRVNYFGDYGVANALGTITYVMVLVAAVYYLRHALKRSIYASEGEQG